MIFLDALASMTSIALLTLVGFGIAHRGWVSLDTELFLPKLITRIVLPPYLMRTIVLNFDREHLIHMIASSLVPMMSMVVCILLFWGLGILFAVNRSHRNLCAVGGTVSNTILIGIPVNIALFGEASLPYVLLYFFANTLFFWVFGAHCIAREGTQTRLLTLKERIKQFLSPPLCGVLLGIAFVILGVRVPAVIMDTCRYLGQLATPLALIFVGITLNRVNIKKDHLGFDILLGLFQRLVLAPSVLLGILCFFPLPSTMAQVFIIQSALPCMAVTSVVAAYYGADKEYASTLVALSTVCGMLTVPLWMTIVTTLFPAS